MIFIDTKKRFQADPRPFRFLDLPRELRELVYFWALCGDRREIRVFDNYYWREVIDYDISTSLLRANRQIFEEAEPILYKTHTFDLSVHIDKGLGFLQGLSARARVSIPAIHVEPWFPLKQLKQCCVPSLRDSYDIVGDWGRLCRYIADNMSLHTICFDLFIRAVTRDFRNEQWVKDFVQIQGIHTLKQRPGRLAHERHEMYKNWEPDEQPNNILNLRLQELLKYLNLRMLRRDIPQPESSNWDVGRSYFGGECFTGKTLEDDEEPGF